MHPTKRAEVSGWCENLRMPDRQAAIKAALNYDFPVPDAGWFATTCKNSVGSKEARGNLALYLKVNDNDDLEWLSK